MANPTTVHPDQAKRGDYVQTDTYGPIGHYVGDSGDAHWIAWNETDYSQMCELFDRFYR